MTCFPSPTPIGLGLGPDSPWDDQHCPGNLGFTAGRDFTCLIVTYVCILTSQHSTFSRHQASTRWERSSTTRSKLRIQSFGIPLDRQSFSAQDLSMSKLLRTF